MKSWVSRSGTLLICRQLCLPMYPDGNILVSVFALTSVRIYEPGRWRVQNCSKICLTGLLLRNTWKLHRFCPAPKYNRVELHPLHSWKTYLFGLPGTCAAFPFVTQIPKFQKFQSTRIARRHLYHSVWLHCNYINYV